MPIDPALDCYAILGVATDAEHSAIRAAFDDLTQRYQPDRFAGPKDEAERRLSDVRTAYEVLADPLQRRRYDYHRRVHAKTASVDQPSRNGRAAAPASVSAALARVGPPRSRAPVFVFMAAVLVAIVAAGILYRYSGQAPQGPSRSAAPIAEKPGNAATAPPAAPETRRITTAPAPAEPADAAALTPPTEEASGAVASPPTAPAVAEPAREEAKRVPAKTAAKAEAPTRPTGKTTAPASTTPCSDVVIVLGLCKSNPPVKDK
jgi:curved DNA-binding protein CbpA